MGFYATTLAPTKPQAICRSAPRSKNRVWNFSSITASDTLVNYSSTAELHQETTILDTKTVSGVVNWLSNDPIGISGGLNMYEFCGSNPVNMRDPFGLATYLYLLSEDNKGLPLDKSAEYLSSQVSLKPDDKVVIERISGFSDFNRALKNNKDIARITYLGHGGSGILHIGTGSSADTNITGKGGRHSNIRGTYESCSVEDLDTSNVRKDAEIYLYSCYSGAVGLDYASIAHSFGEHFNAKAYGGQLGTKFKANGMPYTPMGYINQGRVW